MDETTKDFLAVVAVLGLLLCGWAWMLTHKVIVYEWLQWLLNTGH